MHIHKIFRGCQYNLFKMCTVQPHYNMHHYNAVFNITWPCYGSQTDYFAVYIYMSRTVGKQTICIGENKGADQSA